MMEGLTFLQTQNTGEKSPHVEKTSSGHDMRIRSGHGFAEAGKIQGSKMAVANALGSSGLVAPEDQTGGSLGIGHRDRGQRIAFI